MLAVGAYVYLDSGRYAATDNAYVKADRVTLSSRIAGAVTEVEVRENQRVAAGDVLFVVDPEPFRVALARAEAQAEAVHAFIASLEATYRQTPRRACARRRRTWRTPSVTSSGSKRWPRKKLSSDETLDEARHEVDIAARRIRIVEQQLDAARRAARRQAGRSLLRAARLRRREVLRGTAAALDLEHTVVRAPFDGVASKVPLLGQYVGARWRSDERHRGARRLDRSELQGDGSHVRRRSVSSCGSRWTLSRIVNGAVRSRASAKPRARNSP